MRNKKGFGDIIFIFLLVMLLLAFAFGVSLFVGVGNNFMDEVTPVFQGLGVVSGNGMPGDNMSQNADYLLTPGNAVVNSFNWIVGVTYILSLVMIIALAVTMRGTTHKWAIGLFFLLLILGVILSIVISNSYQDLYDTNDIIGQELHDQTLTSWLILYSPLVTLVIMLISALIMFSGPREEGFA